MPDPEYICLSCGKLLQEWDLWKCHNSNCNEDMCPGCGGEVSTIQEYNEATKANDKGDI